MARLRQTRSASREAPPSSPPKSFRVPPEMSMSPAPTRRSARNTRGSSVDSVQSDASVGTGRKGKGRFAPMNAELSMVAESQEGDLEQQAPVAVMSESQPSQALEALEAMDDDLDTSEMIENLPDLWRASKRLLDRLTKFGKKETSTENEFRHLLFELDTPTSDLSKRLRRLEAAFQPLRDYYGHDPNHPHFINVQIVQEKFQVDDFDGPTSILNAANLTTVVKGLLVDNEDKLSLLTSLDDVCPAPFMSVYDDPDKGFELHLEIRTRYAIAYLTAAKDMPDFNPYAILQLIFGDGQSQSSENMFELVPRKIFGDEVDGARNSTIQARFDALTKIFAEATGDTVIDQLETAYPWFQFLATVVEYAGAEWDAIEEKVESREGEQIIAFDLQQALEPFSGEGATGSEYQSQVDLSLLRQHVSSQSGGSSAGSTSRRGYPARRGRGGHSSGPSQLSQVAQSADDYQAMTYDERESTPAFPATRDQGIANNAAVLREKNKENMLPGPGRRFIDRQSGAERIAFDSQDTPMGQNKRRADEMDEDPSEDEGFQIDRQIADEGRRMPNVPTATESTPIKRQRTKKPKTPGHNAVEKAAVLAQRREFVKQQHAARLGGEEPGTPQFSQLNELAKMIRSTQAPKEPQKRNPWNDHDCALLLEAIAIHQSSWSAIEQAYAGQWERERCNQIDMKDKARNMKVTYLQTGTPLPMGFDSVFLGKKEIAKVRRTGKNPFRREGEEPGEERTDMEGQLVQLEGLPGPQ